MKLMKILIKIIAISFCLVPTVAGAEKLSLDQLSVYLNDLVSAKGGFTQVNPDNTLSKGNFMIKRPGRMRFEYSQPNPALVVASSGQIAIFDKKSTAGPQGFPLGKSPLAIILKKDVNLRASGLIVSHVEEGPLTKVIAQDPKHPDYGKIQLVFTADPVELRQWIVTDHSGQKTTVILGGLDKGVNLPENLFDIDQIAVELSQTSDR
jgi:outer membrane lipoprotein-sorting protein